MIDTASCVLVVEDEREIRRFVRHALEMAGHRVFEADTLQRASIEAASRRPDLVILDLGLPDGDGTAFVRELRTWSAIPVLVLSARSGEPDKVNALDAGADDFLCKPFGIAELLARVRAALRRHRRAGQASQAVACFGDVEVDLESRRVNRQGEPVHLTPLEFRLLAELLRYPGKVLTHRHLLREVWGPAAIEHSHYLRVYMGHLRQKLEADPARPQHLITETGVGYRFVAE